MDFFKEYEIYAEGDEEGAAAIGDGVPMREQFVHHLGECIADRDQQDIADPNTRYKTEATLGPVIEALFDDRKNDGTHRENKNKSQSQSFQYGRCHKES